MVTYHSTRSNIKPVQTSEAILQGLTSDGGLFVPDHIPVLEKSMKELSALTYQEVAYEVMKLLLTDFTEEELKTVDDFSGKIDLNDSAIILQYGAACQKKIAEFSDNALAGVRTKDLGETSDMIADLVAELKGFDVTAEEKGFLGIFKKFCNKFYLK